MVQMMMSNRVYARVRPKSPLGRLIVYSAICICFHLFHKFYARDEIIKVAIWPYVPTPPGIDLDQVNGITIHWPGQ